MAKKVMYTPTVIWVRAEEKYPEHVRQGGMLNEGNLVFVKRCWNVGVIEKKGMENRVIKLVRVDWFGKTEAGKD